MTTPLAPQSRAAALDDTASAPANESAFPKESAVPGATAVTGWDPYEVWRTRILAAQPGYEKR